MRRSEAWTRAHEKIKVSQREFLRRYKSDRGCADCGESDPVVLQYHHRDPAAKKYNVSAMIGSGWRGLLAEIEKCDVLCANCHCRRTFAPVGEA